MVPKLLSSVALVFLVAACGGCGGSDEAAPTESVADHAPFTIDARFTIRRGGPRLALRCWGTQTPTIIFLSGSGNGIEQFPPSLTLPLARTNRACAYDRVGYGSSDPPREERRTVDDVVTDLRALLVKAKLRPPYVLVGQSLGGNIAAFYAWRYPEDAAGLVLLEVGAPTGRLGKEFPGKLGWNNPEQVDWVDADRRHVRRPVLLEGAPPVRIVRASEGDMTDRDVTYFLKLSPLARATTLRGGHDIHEDNPAGVIHQIRATLKAISAQR